jgi:hypothetical protein
VQLLKDKIATVTEFWQELLNRSDAIRTAIHDREVLLKDMNWAERHLPEFIGGRGAAADRKLKVLKDAYVSTMESELSIIEGFHALIQSAKQTLKALENPKTDINASPTLVYWQDDAGEHSFSTESLRVA